MLVVSKNNDNKNSLTKIYKRGFTLVELLLVLVIVGIIYSFVGGSIITTKLNIPLKLDNLPDILREIGSPPIHFKIYGSDCDKYMLLKNDENIEITNKIDIPLKDLIFYRFDIYGEMKEFKFLSYREKNKVEPVCLEFDIYKNGANSSYIIKIEKTSKYYLYSPYFSKPELFNSLEDAKEKFLNRSLNPKTL
jgi:prepilin-type N-terminal cleavage/methylation domain-containing protein